jgi:hypothetical protein
MKAVQLTLRQYCELAGYSYESGWVEKTLRKGDLMEGMITYRKFGNSWMVTVLESWYNNKKQNDEKI